jgi:hypothetical protein
MLRVLQVAIFASLLVSKAAADEKCNENFPCVRFCCSNCTDGFSIDDQLGAEKLKASFKVLNGRPCDQMYVLEPADYISDVWTFLAV